MDENYFAKNLKFMRKQKNYTQEDIAKIVQKDRSLIGHWESAKREPTLEDVMRICAFFSLPIDHFITENLSTLSKEKLEKLKNNNPYYKKELYRDEEEGISFLYVSNKPFKEITKEKQEEIISQIMDELYEYKRNLKKEA